MSSVIVLDSSDEDETPAKRPFNPRSIPATITPIPATITPISVDITSGGSVSNSGHKQKKLSQARTIPSGITITRRSPITATATTSPTTMSTAADSGKISTAFATASNNNNSNNTMLTALLTNVSKPPLPILPKINAAFSLSNNSERQTPTPPRQQQVQQQKQQQSQQQQQQPNLLQMPQLQVARSLLRRRKTPTPPLQQQQQQSQLRATATPPASTALSSIGAPTNNNNDSNQNNLLPMISSVQSMAAGATPPLQLLATPPHSTASTFNEQLMISPQLIPAAQLSQQFSLSASNSNSNNNNNNYKIQLPPKRSTVNTPSPVASPVLRTPPPAPSPRTLAPATTATTTSNISSSGGGSGSGITTTAAKGAVRRVKPTTLLRPNDEAWLQRARISTLLANDDNSLSPKSTAAPNSSRPAAAAAVAASVARTAAMKVINAKLSSPLTVSVHSPQSGRQSAPLSCTTPPVLDLTESPSRHRSESSPQQRLQQANGDTTTNESVVDESPSSSSTTTTATATATESKPEADERAPLEPDYEELLQVCREADPTPDMEKLIQTKLIKYYYSVHSSFVRSRGFRKSLRSVIENIREEPELVYLNLKTIVDELKVRSKGKAPATAEVEANNGETSTASTGNKHTDEQIKKLNKALYILTKRIVVLETAEVNWDDEDSTYLQVERYKKRACQIYEKICDLTGESKNAHRLVKKSIQFSGTPFTQFNKTLQAYINRTREFPDYYDVLRMLEHCNREYDYSLAHFEMKRIAHDAFMKVGKLLQSRRKTDLYETVTHFTANTKDPATTDPTLQAKLSENQKLQKRIGEIIEKYAREQDVMAEELKEARQSKAKGAKNEGTAGGGKTAGTATLLAKENGKVGNSGLVEGTKSASENVEDTETEVKDVEDNDDDEDDDDEEEDEENANLSELEADVDKLANGDLSDAESESETAVTLDKVKDDKDKTTQKALTKSVKSTIAACDKITAAARIKSASPTNTPASTPVNNNQTRAKTGEHFACTAAPRSETQGTNAASKFPLQQQQIPNGRMKASGNTLVATQPVKPLLKIVSVSSLNESVGSLKPNTVAATASALVENPAATREAALVSRASATTTPITKATSTVAAGAAAAPKTSTARADTASDQQKQRTVAEIVISDEES